MIGRTVAHYAVERQLGAGAMGEVYLATDTSLGRKVALKFLPDSLSDDTEARTRLLHEAQNASLLNHPNVVTIHAIEHVDGLDFIVMEFIEGRTLKDILAEEQLTIERIVEIGCALCEGLSAAHEKGIIHRDIKPDNIFVTPRGHIKIADFGIARSQQGAGVTRTGMPVGTVAYMSPEQARGEKNLDARSDLFSLGCVIYEMAVGRRPFEGEHLTAVLYELLSENPPAPSSLRSDLPVGFDTLIQGVLAKDREARYQSAAEVAEALRGVAGANVPAPTIPGGKTGHIDRGPDPTFSRRMKIGITLSAVAMAAIVVVGYLTFSGYFPFMKEGPKRLAVLPFNNFGASDQDYFADGLTDEVITRLGRINDLRVVSRTSVWKYRDTDRDARDIASDLGVEYLVEGSVKWASKERVSVTSRLVLAKADERLWEVTYDTLLSDILAVQTDIAERVTGAMHITLMESDRKNLARGGSKNGNALLSYYHGLAHFHGGKAYEQIRDAIVSFKQAVAQDPEYVQAWSRLSLSHAKMVWYGFEVGANHGADAKAAMETALRLDPESPDARTAAGYYYYWVERNLDKALEEFAWIEKSGVKSSELYEAYEAMAYVLRRRGEFDKSLGYLITALSKDPDRDVRDAALVFAERAWEIGNTFIRLKRWTEADGYLQEALRLTPNQSDPYKYLSWIQLYGLGNPDSAYQILTSTPSLEDSAELGEDLVAVSIARRDPVLARKYLKIFNDDTAYYNLQSAWIAELEHNDEAARLAYDSAAADLGRQVERSPNFAALHRFLGIAYAGIGRRDDALREGREALRLQPPEAELFHWGPGNLEGMARIHSMLGEQDEAVALLDSLLRLPAGLITPAYLKIAPEYDLLRGHPRFEMLLSQGQPTASLPASRRVYALSR